MKKILFSLALATVLFACDDDEKIDVKDYGMKTFEADLKYVPQTPHGEVAYTQQTFVKLGEEAAVHIGSYGKDTWTNYNLHKEDEENYNVTTSVKGWDLVFTSYVDPIDMGGTIYPYAVTGGLINVSEGVEVGFYEYSASEETANITSAFAGLELKDIATLEYSSDVDAIAYGWKSVDRNTGIYTVYTNHFFIVKLANEETYKVRFISFHGDSVDERIITMEYALMQ